MSLDNPDRVMFGYTGLKAKLFGNVEASVLVPVLAILFFPMSETVREIALTAIIVLCVLSYWHITLPIMLKSIRVWLVAGVRKTRRRRDLIRSRAIIRAVRQRP